MAVRCSRVYAYQFDATKGERDGRGCRAFVMPAGDDFYKGVFRVEMDKDADEGPATVSAHVFSNDGSNPADILDFGSTKGVTCTFRAYVRIRRKDGSSLVPGGPVNDPNVSVDKDGNIYLNPPSE